MNRPIDWSLMQDYRLLMVGSIASPDSLRGYLLATFALGDGKLSFLVGLN